MAALDDVPTDVGHKPMPRPFRALFSCHFPGRFPRGVILVLVAGLVAAGFAVGAVIVLDADPVDELPDGAAFGVALSRLGLSVAITDPGGAGGWGTIPGSMFDGPLGPQLETPHTL